MPWTVLLSLIVCNAIWATNPVMGKILLERHDAMQVSWLRYGSALATTFLLLLALRFLKPKALSPLRKSFQKNNLQWLVPLGLITFFASAVLQYKGLALSTSTANALIVAMEPLFAVFLALIFLGESVHVRQGIAFVIALLGFFLLSNVKPGDISGTLSLFNFGNLLILAALPCEAMYTVISRKLVNHLTPISIFASALPIGFLCLTIFLVASHTTLPSPLALNGKEWLALLWLGPLGTAITYIYWTMALVRTPVAAVSLTLFAQPILGAFAGTLFLGERLDIWQVAGAALIVGALLLQTQVEIQKHRRAR